MASAANVVDASKAGLSMVCPSEWKWSFSQIDSNPIASAFTHSEIWSAHGQCWGRITTPNVSFCPTPAPLPLKLGPQLGDHPFRQPADLFDACPVVRVRDQHLPHTGR